MIHRLCEWHNYDGDMRGWSRGAHGSPDIACNACRADGSFTPEEVGEYEREEEAEIERRARIVTAGNGAQLRITCHSPPFSSGGDYRVILLSGAWPTSDELINLCSAGHAPFGGYVRIDVHKGEPVAHVYVNGTD
jgi:hypothetical protein